MKKLWVVWETEFPDNGAIGVEADSADAAKLAYERAGYKDGTTALSAQPLTLASEFEGKVLTVEELAGVFKAGHRAIIREADEWRPLANHVLGLIALARKDLPCPSCTEGPMVQWCAVCGHGTAPPNKA